MTPVSAHSLHGVATLPTLRGRRVPAGQPPPPNRQYVNLSE